MLVRLTGSAIEQQTCRHTLEGLLNLIFTLTLDCKHNEGLYFQSPLSLFLSCTIRFTPLKKSLIIRYGFIPILRIINLKSSFLILENNGFILLEFDKYVCL